MEIKLYAFSTGTMTIKKGIFAPGKDDDAKIKVPIQCFLIIHPKGKVLVDTGIEIEVGIDPQGYWGNAAKSFRPSISPSEGLTTQLKSLGYSNEDIEYVILSHLHMDHAGGLKGFPYSNIFVQEKEMKSAQKPESEIKGYYRRDWDYPLLYSLLKGRKDLFGDGTIVIEPLPGHTDGMQVVILDLPKSGKIVLASDAAAMLENLNDGVIARNIQNKDDYQRSIQFLRNLKEQGALIICGHDPEQWENLKKSPEYYR